MIRRRRQEEEVTADDFQWQRGTVLSGSERSGCPDSSLRQRNVQGRIRGRRVAGRLGCTCLAACYARGRETRGYEGVPGRQEIEERGEEEKRTSRVHLPLILDLYATEGESATRIRTHCEWEARGGESRCSFLCLCVRVCVSVWQIVSLSVALGVRSWF